MTSSVKKGKASVKRKQDNNKNAGRSWMADTLRRERRCDVGAGALDEMYIVY